MFRTGLYVNIHHEAKITEGSFVVKQEYHLPEKEAFLSVRQNQDYRSLTCCYPAF